jgi:hypothetical protein
MQTRLTAGEVAVADRTGSLALSSDYNASVGYEVTVCLISHNSYSPPAFLYPFIIIEYDKAGD